MKRFLFEGALILLAALGVMALVFRNSRALEMLRFARNMLWLYVALVLLMTAIEIYQMVN
jgi:hypothetical protein